MVLFAESRYSARRSILTLENMVKMSLTLSPEINRFSSQIVPLSYCEHPNALIRLPARVMASIRAHVRAYCL